MNKHKFILTGSGVSLGLVGFCGSEVWTFVLTCFFSLPLSGNKFVLDVYLMSFYLNDKRC